MREAEEQIPAISPSSPGRKSWKGARETAGVCLRPSPAA